MALTSKSTKIAFFLVQEMTSITGANKIRILKDIVRRLVINALNYDFSLPYSLGAGTAVILSFILRLKYKSVKCFSYGPPGGLLNPRAHAISTTFVTSVVVGDDIICR